MKTSYCQVTVNIAANQVRNETFEGQEYVVAPVVLMPEGVHAGSDGPLYYPGDQLDKYSSSWNHKPIVVNHPTKGGQPVSASDTKIMENSQIGFLLNMGYKDSKQRGEAWLNKPKTVNVAPEILDNLQNKRATEGSTGLFVDNDEKEGTWGVSGEKFVGTAMNHRPDHYAILLNGTGAASVKDGAGLLVNKADISTNELSASDVYRQLSKLLASTLGEKGQTWMGFIEDVYPGYVVFYKGYSDSTLYRQSYTTDGVVVSLNGKPVEVVRTTDYSPVSNSGGAGTLTMKKDEIFAKLIGEGKPFADADKAHLDKLPEDVLVKLIPVAPVTPPVDNSKKAETPTPATTPAPVVNATTTPPKGPTTLEELIANLNPSEKEMMTDMATDFAERRNELIGVIVNAKGSAFKAEDLKDTSMAMLKKMASTVASASPATAAAGNNRLASMLGAAVNPPTANAKGPVKSLGGPPTFNYEAAKPKKTAGV